jgi:predicted protein tyrosine phosphatase
MQRLLFICSRNRLRSPTAEQLFAGRPGIETDSAGLAPDADTPLDAEQIRWADVIFVMERAHRSRLTQRYGPQLKGKKLVCLDIADNYAFMQPELVALLEKKMAPNLR